LAKICIKCGELVSINNELTRPQISNVLVPNEVASSLGTEINVAPVFDKPPLVSSQSLDSVNKSISSTYTDTVKSSGQWNQKLSKFLFFACIVSVAAAVAYFLGSNSVTNEITKPVASFPITPKESLANNETFVGSSTSVSPPICEDIKGCLISALRAAANEDVEAVRNISLRIDELPKPAQGNRPLSRKINAEALTAFNREDFTIAVDLFKNAYQENPRDVEITANYGFALVRVGRLNDALSVLTQALILDPRRTSTWTPIAEAYALMGRPAEALSAMWVGYQWSNDREKSINYYQSRIEKEKDQDREIYDLYVSMLAWSQGNKPVFNR
jgi:tetratricopeptide (TPR) repeat protein